MKKPLINIGLYLTALLLSFCSITYAVKQDAVQHNSGNLPLIRPLHLKAGDTVGLLSSASRAPTNEDITFAKERLAQLGLKVVVGKAVYKRDGYFAGTDAERAQDINQMFANPNIKAIFEVRGGWGSDRVLSMLNYKLIKQHPKIIIGFSDITALLLAIHKETGLVTFHGPLAFEPWPQFTVDSMKDLLFKGKAETFRNPTNELDSDVDIIQTKDRIQTVVGGQATGPLIGGNLSVLVTLLGTPYEPNWNGKILFVEDVAESNYQIDRMLSQLQLAGVFNKIHGFIFGKCTNCTAAGGGYGSKTIHQIVEHYMKPNHIPSYMEAMIGHTPKVFTLPEGIPVTMNASTGSIKMLSAAVKN